MADFKQLQQENQQQFNPFKTNPEKPDLSYFEPEKFSKLSTEPVSSLMPTPSKIDVSKYEKYLGNTLDIYPDLNEARAQAQGGWELTGKALGQSLAELTLGTIQGLGYVAEAPVAAYHLLNGEQADFENWWTRK